MRTTLASGRSSRAAKEEDFMGKIFSDALAGDLLPCLQRAGEERDIVCQYARGLKEKEPCCRAKQDLCEDRQNVVKYE